MLQFYYAYELDQPEAIALVRTQHAIGEDEKCEAIKQLNIHELTGFGMGPGETRQYNG